MSRLENTSGQAEMEVNMILGPALLQWGVYERLNTAPSTIHAHSCFPGVPSVGIAG